jgi:hypothetical protein
MMKVFVVYQSDDDTDIEIKNYFETENLAIEYCNGLLNEIYNNSCGTINKTDYDFSKLQLKIFKLTKLSFLNLRISIDYVNYLKWEK